MRISEHRDRPFRLIAHFGSSVTYFPRSPKQAVRLTCGFRGHSATDSTLIRPPVPHASGHWFHGHPATLEYSHWFRH